jgi:C4-dicarboxylate-specific signal transduction histidine kinase
MIHEINNPLNFATTGLFTLRSMGKFLEEGQRAEYVEILDDVDEGIRRVRDLVVSLRMFSYADNDKAEAVVFTEVVEQALRFLSHEWKDQVQVSRTVSEELTIWANKNKLIQVLVNVLQNSLDALARKSFGDEEKPSIWIEGRMENGKSLIILRDNGEGIHPDHMDKIFDPFFTTKDVGEGMGLGLSICYRIVQQYGGRIHVKSEPGKGSEFRLEFPPAPDQAAPQD